MGNRVLMKRKSQKVSILGTIYKVEFRTEQEDPILSDCFGYVTDEFNMIVIDNWAKNEEMVDWFALQLPKIIKVYKELKCL